MLHLARHNYCLLLQMVLNIPAMVSPLPWVYSSSWTLNLKTAIRQACAAAAVAVLLRAVWCFRPPQRGVEELIR